MSHKHKHRGVALYTKLLKKKVRLLNANAGWRDPEGQPIEDPHSGRAGVVVNVYLIPAGVHYTVMLKDGRLVERTGEDIVIEG